MNVKKTAAAVMAAAVLAVAAPVMGVSDPIGIVASAAEEKLLTFTCPEEFAGLTRISVGNGNYVYGEYDSWQGFFRSGKKSFIHIGEAEIEEWRKTGKLEYKTAEVDSQIDAAWEVWVKGDTLGFMYQTEDGFGRYHVAKFNESGDKVVKVGDVSQEEFFAPSSREEGRSDGYSFSADYPSSDDNGNTTFTYKIKSPDGKEVEQTLSYTPNGEEGLVYQGNSCSALAGKYVGFITWKTSQEAGKCKYDVYGVNKDGSRDTIATMTKEVLDTGWTWSSGSSSEFYDWFDEESDTIYVYTFADEKIHKITGINGEDKNPNCSVSVINGSKVVVNYGGANPMEAGTDRLFDLNEGKALTDTYASLISWDNGETYLASKGDDNVKYYYLNSNGKELAEFDDAVSFKSGDIYVPVVKDGKGWLIDKKMNQVSEKIDASECSVMGEGLFEFKTTGEDGAATSVWATMSKASGGQTTPEKPAAKPVEYADKATGIKAVADEGVLADGAEFTATPVAEETKDNKLVYDFKFTKDGKEVQPNGSVTVNIPVPETLKGKTVYVYRAENGGTYTKMNAKAEGDLITFTTDHFSKYLITDKELEGAKEDNPKTGVTGTALSMAAIAIAGAGLIVVSKKKR